MYWVGIIIFNDNNVGELQPEEGIYKRKQVSKKKRKKELDQESDQEKRKTS